MTGTGFIGWVAAALALTGPAAAQTPDAQALYRQILELSEPDAFAAPAGPVTVDHAAHPDAQSETWLIVAHLSDGNGAPVTLHANLSRLGLRGKAASDLDVTTLWRGHLIVLPTDADPLAEERVSRGLGAAGADPKAVWIDDWTLDTTSPANLSLTTDALSLTLDTAASADPLLADDPELPFRGYTLPSVPVTATLDGQTLTGTAWIDHLWGDVPVPGGPLAYDRLILHLDDGSAVSLLRTRRQDGQGIATLDGTLTDPSGRTVSLSDATVDLTEDQLAGAGLDLTLDTSRTATAPFAFPLTTRMLTAAGTRNGTPVNGLGSLQLSGTPE